MLHMGLFLAAVLMPVQLLFGHLTGDYVHDLQPAKFAAIEGRWHDEQPAAEVLFAVPDASTGTNRLSVSVPVLGSLIASSRWDSREIGLEDFPRQDRPPVAIPFFSFRIMVACGLVMLWLAWWGSWTAFRGSIETGRRLLWGIFLSFPLPFVAIVTGWFTAEVGRQPWTIYGLLRTADAVTPDLTVSQALSSLALFGSIYAVIFAFGVLIIYRLLRAGPKPTDAAHGAAPHRPLAVSDPLPFHLEA